MLLWGIPFLILVFYSAVVVGTYKKLQLNGIRFEGIAKYLFPLYPMVLLGIHIVWFLKTITKDTKKSIRILEMVTLKYPVVIGILMEVLLETIAYKLSETQKITNIKKTKKRKKAIEKNRSIDFQDIKKPKLLLSEYKLNFFKTAS